MAGVIVIVAPSFLHHLFHPTSPIPVEFYVPQSYMTQPRVFILAMFLSLGNFKAQEKDNLTILLSNMKIYFLPPLEKSR